VVGAHFSALTLLHILWLVAAKKGRDMKLEDNYRFDFFLRFRTIAIARPKITPTTIPVTR